MLLLSLLVVTLQAPAAPAPPIRNFLRVTPEFCTGGQPQPEAFAQLKAEGTRAVLNLRTAAEYDIEAERRAVEAAGLTYFNIPVVYRDPRDSQVDEFLRITDDPANRPMLIHCTAAIRAGAFWMIRRVLRDGMTEDAALAEARKVGLVGAPHLETFVHAYLMAHAAPKKGRP